MRWRIPQIRVLNSFIHLIYLPSSTTGKYSCSPVGKRDSSSNARIYTIGVSLQAVYFYYFFRSNKSYARKSMNALFHVSYSITHCSMYCTWFHIVPCIVLCFTLFHVSLLQFDALSFQMLHISVFSVAVVLLF